MDVQPVQSALYLGNMGQAPEIVQTLRARADKEINLINTGETTAKAVEDLGAAVRQSASASIGKASVSPAQASAAYLAQA